jgi:hypothetical protein
MTPFEEFYGQNTRSILSCMSSVSKVQEVDITIIFQANILRTLKENLFMAQNFMKQQINVSL